MKRPTGGDELGELPDDADLGEPVTMLRGAAVELDEQFERRVRGRIERRLLGGDLVEMLWTAPSAILLEFLRPPIDVIGDRRK